MEFPLRTKPLLRGAVLGFALSCVLQSTPASAQTETTYPTRPVSLLVGFPPGGAVDVIGRDLAKGLQELWGQPVVVSNKTGGGSMLAAETAARAAPDGLTLLLASDSSIVVIPFLQEKMPYNSLTDLKPIGLVANIPMMLVASPSMKVKALGEFVSLAKAKPGSVDYASFGFGTAHHISMERLQSAAGIKVNHVPYGTTSPVSDLIAGHIPVMWSGVSSVLTNIQAGKLVPLAVGSAERSPHLPNVPTVAETGYPGFEAGIWVGLLAPAGLPAALTQKIQRDLQAVVRSSAFRERIAAQGNEARSSTTAEFANLIQVDYARNKALFGTIGAPGKTR
jgi:tripartite-type tricarboxylate transporter receptor subunit TctC